MIVYKLWAMGLHLVRFARCLAPAVAFVSITGLAHARTRERAGLIGGISLGAGTVRFGGSTSDPSVATIRQTDDPGADLAANLYIGGMTSRRTAVLFEVALTGGSSNGVLEGDTRVGSRRVTFSSSNSTVTTLVLAGAVQYWVVPRVWVRGGIGAGNLQRNLEVKDADLTITLDRSGGVAALPPPTWSCGVRTISP